MDDQKLQALESQEKREFFEQILKQKFELAQTMKESTERVLHEVHYFTEQIVNDFAEENTDGVRAKILQHLQTEDNSESWLIGPAERYLQSSADE